MKTRIYIIISLLFLLIPTLYSQNMGARIESPIDIGTKGNDFVYTDTKNTENTAYDSRFGFEKGGSYFWHDANEVYYTFTTSVPLHITIALQESEVKGTYIHLVNNYEDEITFNVIKTELNSICFNNLPAGKYMLVIEGYKVSNASKINGNITTLIKGEKVTNTNGLVIVDSNPMAPLPEKAHTTGDSLQLTQQMNYLLALTPRNEITKLDFQENWIVADSGAHILTELKYFDGLGRPVQSIQQGITPQKQDLVQIQEYDNNGRINLSWLPAAINNTNGKFVPISNVQTASKETNKSNGVPESSPFSRPVYESSPLNRVLEQYGPGQDWHKNKKSVKTAFLSNNTTTHPCLLFVVSATTLTSAGNYAANELMVTEMKDEDDNTSYEFKNKSGQVVLTRQINNDIRHDTYYVYDDYGNLRYVLPPLAVDNLSKGLGNDSEMMKQYAYLYTYDHRNRCIEKRLPGTDWIKYIYDSADQLIFSQDGEQRMQGLWMFSISDAFGRNVLSGTTQIHIANPSSYLEKKYVQAKWTGATNTTFGYAISGITLANPTILAANFYDNYAFLGKNSMPNLAYDNSKEADYGKPYDTSVSGYKSKGLLTGSVTAILDQANKFMYSSLYYDRKGRVIQSRSTNHLRGREDVYTAYNFSGQPIKTNSIGVAHNFTVNETYRYDYDHAGRLLETTHEWNNRPKISLVKNEYDELGRLTKKTSNNESLLAKTYTYNVRSWLKSIGGRYNQQIYYNEDFQDITGEYKNKKSYSGNISAVKWITYDSMDRFYIYNYDNLSQLIAANYSQKKYAGNFETIKDCYTTNYQYDKQGNMTKLKRHGMKQHVAYDLVDDLNLEYTGNQLRKVTDSGVKVNISISEDFKDWSNKEQEYAFNKNGAMTVDLNKGISKIEYNSLNLPQSMDIKSPVAEARNQYSYSSGGIKLQVRQSWNPSYSNSPVIGSDINVGLLTQSKVTDYVGNKIYENGVIQRVLVDGGYIEGDKYHFHSQDHLGNNVMVLDQNGVIEQREYYYPFGASFPELTWDGNNAYKYNGKELDKMHGLNLYDYSARHYDPAIGRFTSVDPLAEKFYSWSPYAYCYNNPIKYIDPDGRQIVIPPLLGGSSTVTTLGRVGMLSSTDKVVRITPKSNKHHTIPKQLKGNEAVRKARDGGFKFEGKENKIELDQFSKSSGKGQHGNHPNYTEQVAKKLTEFQQENPAATPEQAAKFLRGLVEEITSTIKNNPSTKTNDLKLNDVNISLPSDKIKDNQPKIDTPQDQENGKKRKEEDDWNKAVKDRRAL